MARLGVKVTLGSDLGEGLRGGTAGAAFTGAGADPATVAADVAVLVADGATPTQAHVTTLNTDWTALNTAVTGDLIISWDTSKITTMTQLRAALRMAVQAAQSGVLTL